MRKAARLGMRRALRSLEANHILIAVELSLFENAAFFQKDCAAMLLAHAPRTAASTAMRTATPLRT